MSGNRRKARELAMQALFYMDSRNAICLDSLALFLRSRSPSGPTRDFFDKLTHGVMATLPDLDKILERFSNHWKVSRMSLVDLNVMRIALFEMLCCDDIPYKVAINEAIDIGKKYGSDESGAFINGILDGIRMAKEDNHPDIIPPEYRELVQSIPSRTVPDEPTPEPSPGPPSIALSSRIKKRIKPLNQPNREI